MQHPSSHNSAFLWKSLYADCRDWCRFAPNSEQGKKACPVRGDAPDGTASWQQVGPPGRGNRRAWGGGRRQICLPRERGGEHHCPAGSSAKIASAFNHPQSPLLAQVSVRGGAVIWPLPVEYRTWWIANRATSRYIVKGST